MMPRTRPAMIQSIRWSLVNLVALADFQRVDKRQNKTQRRLNTVPPEFKAPDGEGHRVYVKRKPEARKFHVMVIKHPLNFLLLGNTTG